MKTDVRGTDAPIFKQESISHLVPIVFEKRNIRPALFMYIRVMG